MTVGDDEVGDKIPVTVSHVLGEFVWLISQTPSYHEFKVHDVISTVIFIIKSKQFHVFRIGDTPVAVAMWANLNEEAESKLLVNGHIFPSLLGEDDWKSGNNLWLIDIIAPFATKENRQLEIIFADIITGILKSKSFKMINRAIDDPSKRVLQVPANAGDELVRDVIASLS